MQKFTPPISERKTEELIEIAHSGKSHWVEEAIKQAKHELTKRKVSKKEQEKIISKWDKEAQEFYSNLEREFKQNENKSYSYGKMLYIFIVAPFILVGKWRVDKDLFELKNENSMLKFKQRIALLISGTLFWTLIVIYQVNNSNQERLKLTKEEEIEHQEWRKEFGYD